MTFTELKTRVKQLVSQIYQIKFVSTAKLKQLFKMDLRGIDSWYEILDRIIMMPGNNAFCSAHKEHNSMKCLNWIINKAWVVADNINECNKGDRDRVIIKHFNYNLKLGMIKQLLKLKDLGYESNGHIRMTWFNKVENSYNEIFLICSLSNTKVDFTHEKTFKINDF